MQRRDLLRTAGFAVASTLVFRAQAKAAIADFAARPSNQRQAFPWGVASADPQPDAVMVWTKLVPLGDWASENLVVQLSRDEHFNLLDFERTLPAHGRDDHTVRVLITRLDPDTTYFYRFIAADGAVSRTGRTWTAPPADVSRPVLVAVASCQSYPASQHGSYRNLINRERRTGERPDFILHLGDYVYGSERRLPLDSLTGLSGPDQDSPGRQSKGQSEDGPPSQAHPGETGATTRPNRPADPAAGIYDYDEALAATRALYDKYHLDRDLQDARALYPFVTIWDDHEFGNDVWQSFSGDGSNPVGRMAATQVWSEWVPQVLDDSQSIPGVSNEARDFRRSSVHGEQMTDFNDDFLAQNTQNLAAIEAMTSYRVIRWGTLIDLIITDNRSYRGPGANPAISFGTSGKTELADNALAGFPLFDAATLNILAEGRFANGGNPPATIELAGASRPNPRRNAPRVSLLGAKQKSWFKNALSRSDARWKVWANAEPVTGFKWDLGKLGPELSSGFNWLDSWDGFPNERKELLRYIRDNKIANVVSLSGDRHAHFASCVADDYSLDSPDYVIPEFTCAGISAFARARNLGARFDRVGISEYAYAQLDAQGSPACTLDATLTLGVEAVGALLAGADPAAIEALAEQGPNPQIAFSDMDSHGYLLVRFTEKSVDVEFVTMPSDTWNVDKHPDGPEALRSTKFDTPAWDPSDSPNVRFTGQVGQPTLGRLG